MKDTYGGVLQRHQRKRKRKNTRKRYDEDEEDENEKNENLKGTFTHFFLRRRCDDKRPISVNRSDPIERNGVRRW